MGRVRASGSWVGMSNGALAMVLLLVLVWSWSVSPAAPGRSGCVAARVEGEERRVHVEEGLLLALAQRLVPEDRELHGAAHAAVRADDAGPDVQLLGGDPQGLGQLLQHLRRGPA